MIHARDVTRTFKTKAGAVEAVRGLNLDVAEGELVAFLGPNGAGKSTS
ncbi:ATP-binding cassette domain-containing protein, partial [Rhizobiaceae sp. 2RAB30]